MDGMLLQTVEGLGDPALLSAAGEIWERLQGEKEEVCRDILAEGPLTHADLNGHLESEPADESVQEIEWHYRGTLEDRLRAINDAQDRLIDGGYGRCLECEREIDNQRLLANPAASLCFACQELNEVEFAGCTL
jgi:RNA polymerase-binding transcription factor DksA